MNGTFQSWLHAEVGLPERILGFRLTQGFGFGFAGIQVASGDLGKMVSVEGCSMPHKGCRWWMTVAPTYGLLSVSVHLQYRAPPAMEGESYLHVLQAQAQSCFRDTVFTFSRTGFSPETRTPRVAFQKHAAHTIQVGHIKQNNSCQANHTPHTNYGYGTKQCKLQLL